MNNKILYWQNLKQDAVHFKRKGGDLIEAIYDSKGCSLQPGVLAIVPGMTLNCLN